MLQKPINSLKSKVVAFLVYLAAFVVLVWSLPAKSWEYDVDIYDRGDDWVCITISGTDSGILDPVMKLPMFRSCEICTIVEKGKFEKFKNSARGKADLVQSAIKNYKSPTAKYCKSR